MSEDNPMSVAGEVTDTFVHRFVVRTATGKVLADLGPKGVERIALREGDRVELWGEMKRSELKVHRITRAGGQPIEIDHEKPHPRHPNTARPMPGEQTAADPAPALRTVAENGFTVLGTPRRKPKHFEILGRGRAGELVELHVDLDGHLRKSKPVDGGDETWGAETQPTA